MNYDLALLSRAYPFDGQPLVEAILATFRRRGTKIEAELVGLTDALSSDPARALAAASLPPQESVPGRTRRP
jgi:hypothetical protein